MEMEVLAAGGKNDQFSILWGGGLGLVDGSNVFKTVRKVCRICNSPDDDDLISVQLVQEQISIAEKIKAITGIEVTSDRRLPQNICLDCLERLRLAFELRQQCIETDARLRASLDATQTPTEEYYVETLEEESEEQMGCTEQELRWEVEEIFEKHSTELEIDEDLSKQESCNDPQPTVALSETAECPTKKRSASWREDVHYVLVGSECFPCCGCTMTFESEDDLQVHSIRYHRKRQHCSKYPPEQCTVCYETFTSPKALERHRAHADGQRKETFLQYQCLICNSLFTQQAELFDHLESHVAEVSSMETNDKASEFRIELQSPPPGQTMEDDGDRIDEDSVAETLDEVYSIDFVPDDESSQTEEYIEVDAKEEDDEYDDGEYGDEEDTDRDKTRVAKQGSDWQQSKRLLRKEMYQIPEKYLRIVSKKDGYMIVELKQHRCCCCAQFFETTHQLEQHLKKRNKRQQQTTPKEPKEDSSSTSHRYTCEYCGKQFKFPVVYHCHLRMRRQRQFYFCTLCKTAMESEKRMLSHMVHTQKHAAHFNLPYEDIHERYYSVKMPGVRCCGCGQQFTDEDELTDHVLASHPPGATDAKRSRRTHPFGCDVCGRRFSRQTQLDNHKAMGMVDTPTGARTRTVLQYYCKLCSFDTAYHRRMELHQRSAIHSQVLSTMRLCPLQNSAIKLDRLRYCCFEQCKKSFTDLGELYEHVREIHSEALAKNKCTVPEQEEDNAATKAGSGAGTVECDVCGLWLKHQTALKRHQTLQGPQDCVCSVCGVKKRSRAVLLAHERTHTGERPYSCDECDKTFASFTALRSHQKCHQPRKLECDVCQERFARLENLKRHVQLKHGEATHQCQSCPKKFKTRDTLNIHLRTHTGEKPYKCRTEGCDKWYVNVSDRRRHEMSSHTMERPHKCSYCETAFIRKRQLAIHERRHTGERPYVCSDCGKAFLESGLLRKHIRNVCPNAASDGTVAPG